MGRYVVWGLALLAACADQGDTLVITGSSTVAPLVSELGKRFEAAHPGVRVDVQTGGSQRGVNDAANGLADLGMASRARKDEDPADLVFTPIATDAIALIVHADNRVPALASRDVARIYTGEVTRWSEVGGPDAPITVVNKAEGRSTLEVFCQGYGLKPEQIRASVVIGDNQQGIKTVAGNPNAVGYVSIGSAETEIRAGTPIRMLEPETPLARPLSLVTRGPPAGLAGEFVTFARDVAQRDLVEALAFVPLAP